MSNALDELNLAIQTVDWSDPVPSTVRFYYDPRTKVGTRIGGSDDSEPFVIVSQEQYQTMSADIASKFYLSKSGEVKRIPVARGMQKLLEYSDTGTYRTLKDCMIFVDPLGPDVYQKREIVYD